MMSLLRRHQPNSVAIAARRCACAMLAAACLAPAGAAQGESLDDLARQLREQTKAQRAQAEAAWKELGTGYLANGDEDRAADLRAVGSALQIPVLRELDRVLAKEDVNEETVHRILSLLNEVANKNGADRVAARLGDVPESVQGKAFYMVAKLGSRRSQLALEKMMIAQDSKQRDAAQLALLKYGDSGRCMERLASVPFDQMKSQQRIDALELLAQRELPAGDSLPDTWHAMDSGKEAEALFNFWATHPDADIEEVVLEIVLDRNRIFDLRETGLQILEHGANEYKWRDSKRKLGAVLRDKEGDPLAGKTAWVLHRLGEKSGARYLLEGPEDAVKRDKNSWRAHLALGELEVKLGDFRSAYRSYSDAMRLAGISRGNLNSMDYFYASRAAAGAKKEREAGEWLARSRMSPKDLEPYRDLPEFEPYLDKQPFRRLFGMP